MRYTGKVAFVCFLALDICRVGMSQQTDDAKKLQEVIPTLRSDMKALGEKQQKILDSVDEIKKLLARIIPPPLKPPSAMDVEGDPVEGISGAQVAIIEFTDFQCPFCEMFETQTYPRLLKDYIQAGKAKFFYRDLPFPFHPFAMSAARAARCAGEQGKFWEMHDSLFANQKALADKDLADRAPKLGLDAVKFNQCLSSKRYEDVIQKNVKEEEGLGMSGTPTFFLGTIEPDGHVVKVAKAIEGAQPYETFQADLDELLAPTKACSAPDCLDR